jgi:agmatinase
MDLPEFTPFGGPEVQVPAVDRARVVVLPLCYENAVSYGTGTGRAPYHILEASVQLEVLDEETLLDWSLRKIHTLQPLVIQGDPEGAVLEMKRAAEAVLARDQFLLALGGDHAVSVGPILAAAKFFDRLGVLQIDAHLDLRDEWNGSRYNHACVMRRVVAEGLPIVQVGIRSFSPEEADFVRRMGWSPFYAHALDPADPAWIERAVDALPENVYLTLDLDGLDPSVVPGTGTPEPGGLTYRQVVRLIETLGRKRNVVAADITELAKIDGSQVSEFTAAKLATKIMVYCIS